MLIFVEKDVGPLSYGVNVFVITNLISKLFTSILMITFFFTVLFFIQMTYVSLFKQLNMSAK